MLGFRNAPVTKVLVTIIGGCSAASSLFEASRVSIAHPLWRLVSSQWVFADVGSTVVGTWLIYKLRIIERRYGSSKFAALVFSSFAMSSLLHQAANLIFGADRFTANGPYALLFAILYQYHMIVPSTYQIPVAANITMTDQFYVYAAAIQLLLSRFPSSILPCHFGVLIGAVYHSNLGNIRRWRFPGQLRSVFSRYLLPILGTTSSNQQPPLSSTRIPRSPPTSRPSGSSGTSSSTPSNHLRRRTEVELPPSTENIDALVSMFPDSSREAITNALISSRHDLNRAAETLLTSPSVSH
ncbi:hypothetical protein [Absidia glauca]|uniref:CUE domain-containing protein n=1 Tax=Absidia glauca TaxID=4829 RepID=A0A168NDL8_ABSGL|nr:hypothetical protein [Absidia glauca]